MDKFMEQGQAFLAYLADWRTRLPTLDLALEMREPQRVAVVSVDLTKGFCTVGPLSSPRVQAVVGPAARLFERAHTLGIPHFVLLHDTHEPDAVEFNSFPPHCVRGTEESELVPELAALPFAHQFTLLPKNSIDPSLARGFSEWLEQHPQIQTFLVVGDCTDYCVYQIAMALRVRANDRQVRGRRVIVSADCVDTYDVPVDTARALGLLPHPGNLIHLMFLFHMALNGVEIVASVS